MSIALLVGMPWPAFPTSDGPGQRSVSTPCHEEVPTKRARSRANDHSALLCPLCSFGNHIAHYYPYYSFEVRLLLLQAQLSFLCLYTHMYYTLSLVLDSLIALLLLHITTQVHSLRSPTRPPVVSVYTHILSPGLLALLLCSSAHYYAIHSFEVCFFVSLHITTNTTL